jgi:hypothetical protein
LFALQLDNNKNIKIINHEPHKHHELILRNLFVGLCWFVWFVVKILLFFFFIFFISFVCVKIKFCPGADN